MTVLQIVSSLVFTLATGVFFGMTRGGRVTRAAGKVLALVVIAWLALVLNLVI